MGNIPDWLKNLLPPMREPAKLSTKDSKYFVEIDPHNIKTFSCLSDVHNYLRNNNYDVIFDDSIFLKHENKIGNFIKYKNENKENKIIFQSSDQKRFKKLENQYEEFKNIYKEYVEDSENFLKSYNFVIHHPAFWVCSIESGNSLCWDDDCSQNILSSPFLKNGKIQWVLEISSYNEQLYNQYVNYIHLSSSAETIEQAYINLAQKVNFFFNSDGSMKEDVIYEKSDFEKWFEEIFSVKDKDGRKNI